ncbi:5-amino-6-(5-phospho-D-ribitylamino)uracil phosphatase [Citrus sinensis]|uniref:5-amino-6-(5-phospho-D-ribitylamino)uracil phosphatase n=1 Tax=Citrus sinensis TaxID=2711 RepID=A0ACB8LPV6_CITSI|nr:5-amino-6-(5-phospho-D-ribitylamino)uracil phosphatase [Citrus sinensis]KAH9775544.1 5-amino-6-(5-phospho-D-ribitylamino)uracil phosphatase [Citrus sinensis]
MVVDSIAATSFLGHPPLCQGIPVRDLSSKKKFPDCCRFPVTEFLGRRIVNYCPPPRMKLSRSINKSINALAMELTKETYSFREEEKIPLDWRYQIDTGVDRKPGLWPPENKADNPSLHNPLLRQERMGCGWLGAIFEWEGVIIEDNPDLEKQAWLTLAQEEGKSPPPAFILRRIEGMKNEQAISEVLCWSRDPAELRRMASRMEEIYQALQAQLLKFIPERCIVFGNSNQTVEAAHDARMKCVAVASKHPVYELGAADLVVRHLDELSVVDLKNLADIESTEFGSVEPEMEVEEEEEGYPSSLTTVDDIFW